MAITRRTESIEAPDGGRFDGPTVLPEGGGPGILLLQEIFGVGEFLLHKADALAAEGYVVLCPDVFWRIEPNVALAHDESGLTHAYSYAQRYGAIDPALAVGDLLAALEHLRSLAEVNGRVAVMGYCLGGRLAYEVAVAGDPDCAVCYYGSGIADRLGDAARITCPVLFHYGTQDQFIPSAEAAAVSDTFGSRPEVEIHLHENAGHAFENSFAPAFSNPAASERSWPLTLEFLRRELHNGEGS
jgi:carboxymethylenebutenolidase